MLPGQAPKIHLTSHLTADLAILEAGGATGTLSWPSDRHGDLSSDSALPATSSTRSTSLDPGCALRQGSG
jgi:hypothetical protein